MSEQTEWKDMKKLWILKKKYEDIIKANKNNIIFFAYQKVKFLENLREIENLNVLLNNLK